MKPRFDRYSMMNDPVGKQIKKIETYDVKMKDLEKQLVFKTSKNGSVSYLPF